MKFSSRHPQQDEPEINLIPMIDILLVILIFLMATTSYAKFAGLDINLPKASTDQSNVDTNNINVFVNASGDALVNDSPVPTTDIERLRTVLLRASPDNNNPLVTISADAQATHQAVINVMQAAQLAGYSRLTFAVQTKRP